MSKRRMISLQIVDTDAFLEMPLSTQALYFHFLMRADDEGFIGNPKKILKLINAQDDDFKILISKRFILIFETGIVVIKHWLIHNTIRMDRFHETVYEDEKKLLTIKNNKAYTENGNQMATNGCPKLSKVNLSKSNLSKSNIAPDGAEIIPNLLNDKQLHIQIIGLYANAKNITFNSKEQQQSFIRRNSKSASLLKTYEPHKIAEVMEWLEKNADFKWTLETVGKYIDEDLNALQLKNSKIVQL